MMAARMVVRMAARRRDEGDKKYGAMDKSIAKKIFHLWPGPMIKR
jgi:hypothetical protein